MKYMLDVGNFFSPKLKYFSLFLPSSKFYYLCCLVSFPHTEISMPNIHVVFRLTFFFFLLFEEIYVLRHANKAEKPNENFFYFPFAKGYGIPKEWDSQRMGFVTNKIWSGYYYCNYGLQLV